MKCLLIKTILSCLIPQYLSSIIRRPSLFSAPVTIRPLPFTLRLAPFPITHHQFVLFDPLMFGSCLKLAWHLIYLTSDIKSCKVVALTSQVSVSYAFQASLTPLLCPNSETVHPMVTKMLSCLSDTI